jgi:hypothetical protein
MEPDLTIRRSRVMPHHEGGGRGAASGEDSTVVSFGDGLFVTAVEYPPGYDWRRDSARADIRGRLLLLRQQDDGILPAFDTILALEAGKGRAVSLDPDRHHFTGGHLYTECITELGTVYRRDGRTVHISREREYVRGILARDEDLYVLSMRLDGGGFILRRNWKPILSRDAGRLHGSSGDPAFGRSGALFADRDQVCFLYENEASQWLLVRDRKEELVSLPPHMTHLYDIHCIGGNICLVCRIRQRDPILYVGSKKFDLSTSLNTPVQKSGFRILRGPRPGDDICLSGTFRLSWNQQPYTGLWSPKQLLATKKGRCDWLDKDTYLCRENGRITEAGLDGALFTLDGSGSLMMPACALRTETELFLALSGDGGDGPVLWVNGRRNPLKINGFLTSVTRME